MEGIGSRTGRPSSRYGSAPVFAGPVRRWQKQWVHVSSSSSSISYNHSNNFNSNGGNNNNVSAIRLRRWTPVPPARSGGDSEAKANERPRRKLRYTPIVALDGKKKEAEKADIEVKASKTSQSLARGTLENDDNEKRSIDNVLEAKAQASDKSATATKDLNNRPMDLDTDLKGHDEEHASDGANEVADWVKAARRGFAR